MQVNRIDEGLSVSPQISPEDVPDLAMMGFRAIVCNRPDGEGPDQPTQEEIAAVAKAAGLEMRYLPVVAGMVSDDDAAAFAAALRELPGPVLAYCHTGTRSATLWSLAEAGRRPLPDILRRTRAAGYDVNGVARRTSSSSTRPASAPRWRAARARAPRPVPAVRAWRRLERSGVQFVV